MTATDRTVVNRLRVVGPGRVASAVAAADLRPPGLPRAAVLCVRRLVAPRLAVAAGGVTLPPAAWEDAVRGELDRLARSAPRPVAGPVPEGAEAVLFADGGELLACLTRDWLDGSAARRWWWRGLYRDLSAAAALARIWADDAAHVPAALEVLVGWGLSRAAVAALTPPQAAAVLRTLTARFAAPRVWAAFEASRTGAGEAHAEPAVAPERDERTTTPRVPAASAARGGGALRVEPPWVGLVPEAVGAGLTPEQEGLLGVARLLHRAPERVRSVGFADAVRRWRVAAAPLAASRSDDETLAGSTRSEPATARPRRSDSGSVADDPTPPVTPPAGEGVHVAGAAPPAINTPRPAATASPVLPVTRPAELSNTLPAALPEGRTIATRYGGVFYLVNLGIGLGLYGDFTEPARPGLSLPIWDFLELVARGLLGDRCEPDPVWGLLAELAGRDPATPPGAGFEPPADCPDLLPTAAARLRLALGLAAGDDLPGLLLARPAQVAVTPARLDVTFRLNDLPIQVRLSGLDRDPGWVPAAGRSVAFHYD